MKQALLIAPLLLGLTLTFSTTASAADANGRYEIQGYGGKSCGAYGDARRQPHGQDAVGFLTWITGYITATNYRLAGNYDIAGNTDLDGLMGWLDNYCRTNPTDRFGVAAEGLVIFLYPTRKRSADK